MKQKNMEEPRTQNDHDLLITLNVRVQDLVDTLKRIDGNMAKDIGGLRDSKLDRSEFTSHLADDKKDSENSQRTFEALWKRVDQHEKDIKGNTKYIQIGLGIVLAFEFLIPLAMKYIFK